MARLTIYDRRERALVRLADALLFPIKLARRVGTSQRLADRVRSATGPQRVLCLRLERIGDLLMTLPAFAQTCRLASAPVTRPLVELYTSEGCNSCPPADRWLAAQFPARAENSAAVALAFHVDYWDRLGWVDRFASNAYTERQHAAMRANGATFVPDPGRFSSPRGQLAACWIDTKN